MKAYPIFKSGKVYIKIDHQGKQSLWLTEFKLEPNQWRTKPDRYGHRIHKHPLQASINRTLSEYVLNCEKIWKLMNYTEARQLKNHLDKVGFMETMASEDSTIAFIQAMQIGRSEMAQATHRTLIYHLKKYDPNIGIGEWTRERLDEFQRCIWAQPRVNSQNTVWGRMRDLRSNLNMAMERELIAPMQNPFYKGYKVKRGGSRDSKLSADEVKRLWAIVDQHRSLQVWFLALFLDGARFGEVMGLTMANIVNGRIEYEVSKRGHDRIMKSIPIDEKMQRVIDLTRADIKGEHLIGFTNGKPYKKQELSHRSWVGSWNSKLNVELKHAARFAKVQKNLTMHTARNTFAALAVEGGYSIIEVQDALKHSNIQVTRNYIGRLQDNRLDAKRKGLINL